MSTQNNVSRPPLRGILQKTILEEVIGNPASASRWKVLIMDGATTKVASSALTMFDIMERNVSLVENLELKRQSFPDMDAVYFITPTKASALKVMSDFVSATRAEELSHMKRVDPVCRYGSVHLIFAGPVPQDLIELFQSNSLLISKVQTFREVHLGYLAVENSLYHLDMPDSLSKLYGQMPQPACPRMIGQKLATVCVTLNEHPNIRFQQSSSYCRVIAQTLEECMVAYKRANPTFWVHGDDGNSDRAQILILDRTFDPLSPLMHEFTYQVMANDLLYLDDQGMVSYVTTTERGATEKQAILNSETDELWKEHRHKHIAKVIASIKERMDDILQTSANAKMAKNKNGGDVDISEMAAAVKDLPEYKQTMQNLGRHVAITQQCMKNLNTENIINMSAIEQTLSTGMDEDGKEVKGSKATEMLMEVMLDRKTNPQMKMRLLMIFFITQRPPVPEDRKQLCKAAKLTGSDQQLLMNLEDKLMGALDMQASVDARSSSQASAKGGFFSRLLGGSRTAEKIDATAEGEYTDTRHVCQMKVLLEKMMNGQLPTDNFPSMGPAMPYHAQDTKSTAQSARKFKPTGRWGGKDKAAISGGRFLCFVAGGVSYTESRAGYELMEKENKEVIVGGTHMINPETYINDIESLGADALVQSEEYSASI